ncbi:MAG: DMT family transporter [Solirubrobacteraceae bacterium]|nr:DMT family transporter [Solirubrobacteraceae bacterium]
MLGLALALGASVAWGGSDFVAGLTTRRRPLLAVLVGSQLCGLLAVAITIAVAAPAAPPVELIPLAAAAGLAELGAFAALYRGLARGPMGVVAPIAALGGAVPLAVGLAVGEQPGAVAAVGLVLALAGVGLVSTERERGDGPVLQGLLLAAAAALGFGTFFVLTAEATAVGGATWTVAINRAASVSALGIAVLFMGGLKLQRNDIGPLALIGLLDIAANALFAVALTAGVDPVVSAIGSLYPLTTVLLAQLVLDERLSPTQGAGVIATLAGVALVGLTGAGA